MMRKKMFFACCMLLAGAIPVGAQKKIVLENIRYRTAINYLQDPEMQRLFASNLNALLLKHIQLPLADTTILPLWLVKDNKDLSQQHDYRNTDSSILHLLIDVFELPPASYFSSFLMGEEAEVRKKTKTVFHLNVVLADANNNVRYNEPLYLLVKNSVSPGMGNESPLVNILPKTFVELMKAGLNIILNPKNELEQVTVTVAPAFAMDNYLAPVLMNQPRIYADTANGFINFFYKEQQQMMRFGEATNEQIVWKGKNARKYPEPVIDAIRAASHTAGSSFLFMREEERDVMNNRNYQLQLMIQVPPPGETYNSNAASDFVSYQLELLAKNGPIPSYFVEGPVHLLLQEQDTLASFSIQKDVKENDKLVFPNRIYNGVDSNSAVLLTDALTQELLYNISQNPLSAKKTGSKTKQVNPENAVWSMEYAFMVNGRIKGRDFSIKYGGFNHTIKEFYLDKKLACIAQGRTAPEKIVVFDASLPTEILNPLLLLGFSNFFR